MSEVAGKGWLGSIRTRVAAEVREQSAENSAMRAARYSLPQRILRAVLDGHSFSYFLVGYAAIDVVVVLAECGFGLYQPNLSQTWTNDSMKGLLKDAAGFLITAQIGILGVVSVAVGLVTLIAQRDDQSSGNTDINLYYVEGLAYELVSSSAALAIVLCIQVFWPLQFFLHLLGVGGASLFFKVGLTGVHVLWLSLNLAGFGQFIITTLRFVEPTARERMRERYTANRVVPADLTQRLLRVFLNLASQSFIPQTNDERGPLVSLGHDLIDDGVVEIQTDFRGRHILWDIKTAPVGLALRSWWRRSERHGGGAAKRPRGTIPHNAWLSLLPAFDRDFEGKVTWCRRRGGVAFLSRERMLIRFGFRFRKPGPPAMRDLPTPDSFLEDLAAKVIGQIERLATSGFKAALDEMARYHRFLLEVHNSQSAEGQPLNLAEVGGFMVSPHESWVRQYRRVFERAAERIDTEPDFMERLAHLPMLLLPRKAGASSPSIVRSLLDLGILQTIFLEQWVTRRTTVDVAPDGTAQPRLRLSGSDRLAYENLLLNVVGAWENTLRLAGTLYEWKEFRDGTAADYWRALTASWPFVERHLRNSAYMLALAAWNEDSGGADRYRDMLLRWLTTLHAGMSEAYIFMRYRLLLTTELLSFDWPKVEQRLVPFVRDTPYETTTPEALFFLIVRRAFDDVVHVATAVVLSWYVAKQQATDIGGTVAGHLLRRQLLDDGGTQSFFASGAPETSFRSIFSTIVRASIDPRFSNGRHGNALDSLVSFLDQMSERRVVPGRIYSSWGRNGLEEVAVEILAMLLVSLPAKDDDGAVKELREIAADDALVMDDDRSLRQIVFEIGNLNKALVESGNQEAIKRGVAALSPNVDVDTAAPRLTEILDGAIDAVENERTARLRRLPLDPTKVAALQQMLQSAQESVVEELHLFKNVRVVHSPVDGSEVQEVPITGVDKGEFTASEMSTPNTGLNDVITDIFRDYLAGLIRVEFSKRLRRSVEIDVGDYPLGYWQRVISEARAFGTDAVLLVPNDPIADDLVGWQYGRRAEKPPDIKVEHHSGRGNGGGVAYIATVEGIDVFMASGSPKDASVLLSATALRSVTYHRVPPGHAFVTLRFEEGDDLRKGAFVGRACVGHASQPKVSAIGEDTCQQRRLFAPNRAKWVIHRQIRPPWNSPS